ncbi:MAG TPA: ketoacyl-ACP synthase III [Syntrophales bacterium]|nr:ketoacyl-ACP synthase III [Syntrophales bacterium]
MRNSVIISTGSYLPEKVVGNEDLIQFPQEAIHLIGEKTGVFLRRVASDKECTSDLAVQAAMKCLNNIGYPPENVEGIILATSSPDRMQPATATRVQHIIGAKNAFAFDINSVCSGSAFGIAMADALIKSGYCGNILLLASEVYSKIMNQQDFSSYPFFGDGAGAVLFQAGGTSFKGVLHSCLRTDGSGSDAISVPAGGTMLPFAKMTNSKLAFFKMKGVDVFNFAVDKGSEIILQLLKEAGVKIDDVKCFICHQANVNIIHRIASILSVSEDRFFMNLSSYGNTAAASVLIALDEAISTGVVKKGNLIVTVAFGGGLSWGANLIRI